MIGGHVSVWLCLLYLWLSTGLTVPVLALYRCIVPEKEKNAISSSDSGRGGNGGGLHRA
jgi:hypothetical protein